MREHQISPICNNSFPNRWAGVTARLGNADTGDAMACAGGRNNEAVRQEKVARRGEVSSTAPHRLRLEEKLRPKPDASSSVVQCASILYQRIGEADELPDFASVIDIRVNPLPYH
jgi:hypothetical protein